MRFERRILLLSLTTGVVGTAVSLFSICLSQLSIESKIAWALLIVGVWLGLAFHVRTVVAFPLRTLSNLMGALREGDYTLRARGASQNDAMGEAVWELNALAESLREQRLGAVEATALLRRVMAQVDIAVFGFDAEHRLRLVNESGRQLIGKALEQVTGQSASELGLEGCLDGPTPRVVDLAMAGRAGRWEVRRGDYREKGVSHQLVFLSDLTRTLHEEERLAWKRLIQVLRHEINNSLTPIQSVAQSLNSLMNHDPRPSDWESDMRDGLDIIAERSEQLDRFVGAYSRLTHLPKPSFSDVDIKACVRHAMGLEQRMTIVMQAGSDVTVRGDRGQIEQLLINIISNAVEASMEAARSEAGAVSVGWQVIGAQLELWVDDDGVGVDPASDPFIPFFTTKPYGSGIGLVLSRQIAEAHGGSLMLENHPNAPGCRACLRLPVRCD
jgi:nitrogen fixation/metabolism regulation signal transduction histidine kinase